MKRLALTLAALAVFSVLTATPAKAGDIYFRGYHHSRFHDRVEHRTFHRSLIHRNAHSYPMTRYGHDRLHDALDHDAFHDHLEHRSYHRRYSPYRSHGIGYRSRDFSIFLRF